MQNLHLVGFTTDRRHLIFSARQGAKSGSFLVPVDDELLAALEDLANDPARVEPEVEEPDQPAEVPAPQQEPKLSVREVQARLRAGAAVEEIAGDAGVDLDWVERFAPPVRAEQQQIVELARSLPLVRPRAGASAKPLGVAVAASMAERGVAFTDAGFDQAWSARLIGSDHWIIEFSFVQRGHRRTVAWTLDMTARHLTTSDRTASQIGFVAPPEARPKTSRSSARPTSASDDDGVDAEAPPGERSTRGDGRPDTVRSTSDVRRARTASEQTRRKKPAKKQDSGKKPTSKKAASTKRPATRKSTSDKTRAAKTPASKKTTPASKKTTSASEKTTSASEKMTPASEKPQTAKRQPPSRQQKAPPRSTTTSAWERPRPDPDLTPTSDPADATGISEPPGPAPMAAPPTFVPTESGDDEPAADELPADVALDSDPGQVGDEPPPIEAAGSVGTDGDDDAPAGTGVVDGDQDHGAPRAAPPADDQAPAPTAQFRSGAAIRAADSASPSARGTTERPRPSLTVSTKRAQRATTDDAHESTEAENASQGRSDQPADRPPPAPRANGRRRRTRPLRAR